MGGAQEAARTMSNADSAAVESMVEELVDEVSASTEPVGGADDDDLEEQAAAAVKIQAVHRGKQARKELQEKREQEAAAVKIQAVHRGKQARKELEEKRRDVPEAPPAESAVESDSADVESMVEELVDEVSASTEPVGGADDDDLKEQAAAAVKIQAVHRGKQARKELQEKREMESAAVKIQAVHRGKQARKELEEKRRDVPEAPPAESVASDDPSTTDPVRAAFDKFDADGSGKLERGELLKVLEDLGLDVSDGEFVAFAEALMEDYDADGNGELDIEEFKKLYAQCLESDETRKAYVEELRAAVGGLVGGALSAVVESDAAAKIQAVHRGKQARKELQEKREMESAAVKIQAVHRGKQARKELEEKRRDVPEAPPAESVASDDPSTTDPVRAAFDKFDADGSGKLERGELLKVLEDLGLDVSDGEFVAFAEALMEDYDADGNGELDIEEFKKLYAQCLESDETRKAYVEELRAAVGGLVGGALSAVVESDAAAKIQAVHRGKQARKELQEKREQEAAAVKIQAVHRGKQARKELEEKRRDVPEAPPAESAVESDSAAVESMVEELVDEVSASTEPVGGADDDDLEEQAAAAVKIQAVHRGKQARKELQEKREQESAAVKIQAVHRGKQARKEIEEKREMESAALKIQAVHRGKQTRMELRKEREEQECCGAEDSGCAQRQTNAHGAT